MTMEIDFLRHYDFSPQMIQRLKAVYGENLLPLQELVIREGKLFEHSPLIICAPTSSGKTMLAELLFLYHVLHARKVVLLVPTRALANQRYLELQERYADLGYEIVLSTRDHPQDDRRIIEGRFHLAVVIYEKMRSLLTIDKSWLAYLGACVVDEVHYLFNPTRGADLEMLLTRLKLEPYIQLLGLSSVVQEEAVADWLQAKLIVEKKRPVNLRQGVLCRGIFSFEELNTGKRGVEEFPFTGEDDEGLAMLEAARHFARLGETTLLFWSRREQCYRAARQLLQEAEPDEHFDSTELDALEPSSLRDFLKEILPCRIAVHTSDLTAGERMLVEKYFRDGNVDIINATSTLAEGLNFPVVNVLTTQRIYTTRLHEPEGYAAPVPGLIQYDQLRNMTGRAGRLGLKKFGRGMIVTCSPGDVQGLLNQYRAPQNQKISPVLAAIPFSQVVLKVIGYLRGTDEEFCRQFLQKTLTGSLQHWHDSIDRLFPQALQELQQEELISLDQDRLYLTRIGELVYRSGLSCRSARQLSDFVCTTLQPDTHLLDILLFLNLLDEMNEVYVFISQTQIQELLWNRALLDRVEEQHIPLSPQAQAILQDTVALRLEHHRAFKRTLLLHDWITKKELLTIEQQYGLLSGAIQRLVDDAVWLMGCLIDTAAAHALDQEPLNQLKYMQTQLMYGLPEDALAWVPVLLDAVLTRRQVLTLVDAGLLDPKSIQQQDTEYLNQFLPPETVRRLLPYLSDAEAFDSAAVAENEPYQIRFSSRPDQIEINGKSIPLTRQQHDLLKCLADSIGNYVSYDTILHRVWHDHGDRKLLNRQKQAILKKARKELGTEYEKDLISVVNGSGFVLNGKVIF
jgi:helicase